MNANEALQKAQQLIDQRGRDYDHEGGERSMGPAVTAFNAMTGHDLSEGDGWLLFELVKTKRSKSSPGHVDSNIDKISYSALRAEAELRDAKKPEYDEDAGLDAMNDPEFWHRKCDDAHIMRGSRCVSATFAKGVEVGQGGSARPVHDSEAVSEPYCGAYQAYNVDVNACLQCRRQWRADEPKPCGRKTEDDSEGCKARLAYFSEASPGEDQKTVYACSRCGERWTDPGDKPCARRKAGDDEGWIEHDGSDRCPLSDDGLIVDADSINGIGWLAVANRLDWSKVRRWRIAEVNGWVRNAGHLSMPPVGPYQVIRVVHRGGMASKPVYANNLVWRHEGGANDIIAYRLEKGGA